MSQFDHLRVVRDERDVVTVSIDTAQGTVNVLDENLLGELEAVVRDLETDQNARLAVFRSAKKSGFLAGADVHRIWDVTDEQEAEDLLKSGQELFQRVAKLPLPTVAVIHGACLGGGLELALACRFRIAKDDTATRVGLPETQLGLIPGWGGTQRLPRVVGVSTAVRLILNSSQLTATQAKHIGLVDAALRPLSFEQDVEGFIQDRLAENALQPGSRGWLARWRDGTSIGQRMALWFANRKIAARTLHYPALAAALRAIEAGITGGMEVGLAREREEFCRVLFDPNCRSLLQLFLWRERARKPSTWLNAKAENIPAIRSIAVLGAGTMGAGIAQLAATRGFGVTIKDVDDSVLTRGMQRIEKITRKAVEKGVLSSPDAESAVASIKTTTGTIPNASADLVIEAIVEQLEVKQEAFRELDAQMPATILFTSNTSALPISEMASVTKRPDRFAGLHFFNPVHKMPLVEIIRCTETSDATVASLINLVRKLGKTPLVVAEGPGFLVNRILFPYLDEAVRLVCEGWPVDQVDNEAKHFGWPMGPLELLDHVGIDVSADVANTLSIRCTDASPTPQKLAQLVAAGHKGQKNGQGFYKYKDGRRGRPATRPLNTTSNTLPSPREFAGEELSGIQQRLVFSTVNAAAGCLSEGIVREPWIVDLGMVLGTGFAPFRGGPMSLIETWGRELVVETLADLSDLCGPRFKPSAYFNSGVEPTRHGTAKTLSTPHA